jgi:hypothetical protein
MVMEILVVSMGQGVGVRSFVAAKALTLTANRFPVSGATLRL